MYYFVWCITLIYLLEKINALEKTNQRIKPCIWAGKSEICDGHLFVGELNSSFTLISKTVLSAHMNFPIAEKCSGSNLSFLLKLQMCQAQTIECLQRMP